MSAPSLVDQMTAAARGGQTAAPDTAGGGSLVDQFTRGTHPSQASTVLPPLTLPPEPPHHGTLGGNLLHDVSGAITGLAVQPVHLAENLATHPIATIRHTPGDIKKFAVATAASEKHTWGPFVNYYKHYGYYLAAVARGDHAAAVKEHATAEKFNKQFNEQFHAHPLLPLSDLTVFAGGVGGRIAALSHVTEGATLGDIAKTAVLKGERMGTPKVLHVNVGERSVPVRTLPRSAYRAGRMEFTHKLLEKIPPDRTPMGAEARAARAERADADKVRMKLLNTDAGAAYMRAFGKLNKWERAAANMIPKLSTVENLDRHIAQLRANAADAVNHAETRLRLAKTPAQRVSAKKAVNAARAAERTQLQQAELFSDPRFRAAYDHPEGKVLNAVEAMRALVGGREDILTNLGEPIDQLRQSVWNHIRMVHGGKIEAAVAGPDTRVGQSVRIRATGRQGKVVSITPEVPESFPAGTLFHGSPEGELVNIDALYHTKEWREGPGFYLTTSAEKAGKYAAGRTANAERRSGTGALNSFRLKPGAKVLDMDAAPVSFWQGLAEKLTGHKVDPKMWDDFGSLINEHDTPASRGASEGVLNRMRLLEYLTGYEEIPKSEAYYAIEEALHEAGYQATKHMEGGHPVWVVKDENALERTVGTPHQPGSARVLYEKYGRTADVPLDQLEHVGSERLVGGGTPEEHAAAIEAAGRPQPFYTPDVLDEGNKFTKGRKGAATGGPTGMLPAQSDIRAWQGVLFHTGQLAVHPDLLSPSFLRATTRAYGQALFENVRDHVATPVERGAGLPAGYRWVRETRGERIPYTESHGGEHYANTDRAFPEIHDEMGDMFGDDNLPGGEIATDEAGMRLAVPQKIADDLRVQQRAVRGNVRRIFDNSTQVWRALVLNLRVPWLINNIVGNHLLAAIRFAGVPGLKAYVGALGEVKGIKAVRELMNLPDTRNHLSDEAMREIFPEHTKPGTGIGTQMPTNAASKVPAVVQKATKYPRAVLGFLPRMDQATEGFLRRWGVETELRRSPEFNRVLKAMPKETRTFDNAARKLAETNKAETHAVSREVNDALGNFNSLTFSEQNYIRSAVPFYAWYREITRIALKLPLDEPLRANILLRLGQAGGTQSGLPSYLQGSVPIGKLNKDGTQTLLALRGMNPYTTPIDLARAISVLWTPKRAAGRSAQGLFNPFISLLATVIDKSANGDTNAKSVLDAFYSDFLKSLPEPAAAINKQSNLYPGRTRWDRFEQLGGSPIRRINPAVAQDYAAGGN